MRFVCPKTLNARAVLETSVTEILLEISKRVLFYDKFMSLKVEMISTTIPYQSSS